MLTSAKYDFRKVTLDDVPTLLEWQAQPYVHKWWGSDEPYSEAEINDPRVSRFIVSFEGHPFAFMQDYSVHGWEDHHFAHLPRGARGIDQYIGDPNMIGVGHGTAFIRARIAALFDSGVPVIATDPHPDNARAIAVYEKLGFVLAGPSQETQWGLIIPMIARP